MCLLALIAERPRYGYEFVESLTERGLSLVSEGSIYPVLTRLAKSGLVETYHVPSAAGPARKYYRITPTGAAALDEGRTAWTGFADAVHLVLNDTRPNPAARRSHQE